MKNKDTRSWNFGLVFKSFNQLALDHLLEKLPEIIPDVKTVYRAGPTRRLLWIVMGSNPQRGESDEQTIR